MRPFSSIVWVLIIALQILLAFLYLLLPWQLYFTLLFLLVLGVLLLIRPEWGVYLLIFLVAVAGNQIGLHDPGLSRDKVIPLFLLILLGTMAGVWMLKAAKIRKNSTVGKPLNLAVCIFALYGLFTLFWSPEVYSSLVVFAIFGINILLFYFVVSMIDSEEFHRRCMYAWLVVGAVTAVLTVISVIIHPEITFAKQLWGNYGFSVFWDPRVATRAYAIAHPNHTSLILNLAISVTIGMFFVAARKFERLLLLLLLVFMVFANCSTFSKGGVGGFAIMGYFVIFFNSSLRKHLFLNMGVFTLGLIVLWLAAVKFSAQFGDPFHAQLLESGGQVMSLATRFEMWGDGFHAMMKESRLVSGLGLGGYEYYTEWPHSHNLLLSFYFDFGLMGLVFVFSVLFVIGKLLADLRGTFFLQETYLQKMSLAFCGGLIAVGVHSIVDHHYNKSILWLYLALTLSTLCLARRELSETVD